MSELMPKEDIEAVRLGGIGFCSDVSSAQLNVLCETALAAHELQSELKATEDALAIMTGFREQADKENAELKRHAEALKSDLTRLWAYSNNTGTAKSVADYEAWKNANPLWFL